GDLGPPHHVAYFTRPSHRGTNFTHPPHGRAHLTCPAHRCPHLTRRPHRCAGFTQLARCPRFACSHQEAPDADARSPYYLAVLPLVPGLSVALNEPPVALPILASLPQQHLLPKLPTLLHRLDRVQPVIGCLSQASAAGEDIVGHVRLAQGV